MYRRTLRVNELIKRELNQIILRQVDFVKNVLVTITRVETSSNLIQAKVYISVVPKGKEVEVLKILNYQVYDLQQEINKRLKMRPVPKIKFVEEKKTKEASRIEELLEKIKNKKP